MSKQTAVPIQITFIKNGSIDPDEAKRFLNKEHRNYRLAVMKEGPLLPAVLADHLASGGPDLVLVDLDIRRPDADAFVRNLKEALVFAVTPVLLLSKKDVPLERVAAWALPDNWYVNTWADMKDLRTLLRAVVDVRSAFGVTAPQDDAYAAFDGEAAA